ncbi:Cytosol aminopeptidase [Zancudomyces culisetae]|uniref:Cytosol aminopeptidase n=1 Tax=Zancudomyces culisetae TaxID=1213189 RepID=A0A1R1PW01_ZANCU|nr:Cytosol aminopeptidase [Zancudomyces culisetae]|eukprot:OMH85128.1 Cytosol aminopeptidase [Zancudomyces culisetae]
MFSTALNLFAKRNLAYTNKSLAAGIRKMSSATESASTKGVVVGLYNNCKFAHPNGDSIVSDTTSSRILEEIKARKMKCNPGDCHLFYERGQDGKIARQIAVVGLGDKETDSITALENARIAFGAGVRALEEYKISNIEIEASSSPQSAAEGVYLATYKYDAMKSTKEPRNTKIEPIGVDNGALDAWKRGMIYAQSQNWARTLANTPANLMTPTIFGEECIKELSNLENVTVNVYDKEWIEQHKMGAFLSVAVGSDQPPKFVEIIYKGGKEGEQPIAYVGKGITFDSGGISIKPSKGMDLMKGDMGGAAAVVAAMRGIAALKLPINAVCCVPLTENLPSGKATKPGDVVVAMNGKTVEVLNTDAEGRMVLADALTYVVEYHKPTTVVDVATLTGAIVVALGDAYSGVFTQSSDLWKRLKSSGVKTGDEFWRMPMHSIYAKAMESKVADLQNISSGKGAGSASAAMFLKEFVGPVQKPEDYTETKGEAVSERIPRWAHIDIAGTMDTDSNSGHQVRGMTGRPTRTLIELAQTLLENPY